jgi:hypothetical protein
VRIEIHFINTTTAPLEVGGHIEVDTVPQESAVTASDLAFWGTTDITLPPNSPATTGVKFQPALAATKSFALTTHQHHLGTRMRVWYGDGVDVSSQPVADATNWAAPPLVIFDPPLVFPANGAAAMSRMGFAYDCEWTNPTPSAVSFGESANDEMCFLWHYYYPSKGFSVCVDGACR